MKTTPITQRAKSTPFKMNQGLVTGAEKMYATQKTGFEEKEEVEVATENNQQPVIPTTGEDGTTGDNTEKKKNENKKGKNEGEPLKKAQKGLDNFNTDLTSMGLGSTLGTVRLPTTK